MAQRPLRFGILGCANIARAFASHVTGSTLVRVDAVASRDAAKAAAFAAEFGIGRHHASYEALLADAAIDAVYIPLPNSLHAEWAIAAARAAKHVLCEKPLALDADQARAMFAAARTHGVALVEGFPYWFQPQTGDLVRLLHTERAIGDVRWVQASFAFRLAQPAGNIRMDPALGGGALLDAGSYPLSLIHLAMQAVPATVQAHAVWTDTGVDMRCLATLFYADGRMAQLACDMDGGMHRHATIEGSQGVLLTEFLNHTADAGAPHPMGWQPSSMRLRRQGAFNQPYEQVISPSGSGFRFAAEALADVLRRGDQAALDRAAEASIGLAATLAALARSARSGRAEPVA